MSAVKFKVANTAGRAYRIEATMPDGRIFTLQPEGQINIGEAKSLCEAIVFALGAAGAHDPIEEFGRAIRRAGQPS